MFDKKYLSVLALFFDVGLFSFLNLCKNNRQMMHTQALSFNSKFNTFYFYTLSLHLKQQRKNCSEQAKCFVRLCLCKDLDIILNFRKTITNF